MVEDLAVEAEVDVDDLADDELLPDEAGADTDLHDSRRNRILEALDELGPATAREIGNRLERSTANVSTRLRQLEEQGRVRRTGKSVSEPGARGGPSIEWERMPVNGHKTGPGSPMDAPPGPVEDRLRAMAEKLGRALQRIEHLDGEVDGAKARADQADARARTAEERRQDAERRAATAAARLAESEGGGIRAEEHERLSAEIARPRARLDQRPAPGVVDAADGRRQQYFDLLLSMAAGDGAEEHIFDRLERLIDGSRHDD